MKDTKKHLFNHPLSQGDLCFTPLPGYIIWPDPFSTLRLGHLPLGAPMIFLGGDKNGLTKVFCHLGPGWITWSALRESK